MKATAAYAAIQRARDAILDIDPGETPSRIRLALDDLYSDLTTALLAERACSNVECVDGIDQHVNAPCQECARKAASS